MWHKVFQQLGLVPAESRRVRPMPAHLKSLVPKPTGKTVTIMHDVPDPEFDTVPFIIKRIKATLNQTKQLAAKLKGSNLAETLRNNSNFILNYILYRKDHAEHEQVRDAARTVHEGKGDCDCYVELLGGILTNQKIKFFIVTTSYPNQGHDEWSHTYIVVPKNQNASAAPKQRSEYIVLDPVTNRHDYEVTPIKNKKYYSMSLQSLQGISNGRLGACDPAQSTTEAIEEKSTEQIKALRTFVLTSDVVQQGLVPTYNFLKEKGYAFTEKINPDTNKGYFEVATPNGAISVPTIITQADALELEKLMNAPVTDQVLTANAEQPKQAGLGIWAALGLAAAALGSIKPISSTVTPALGSPRKRRVVHI